MSEVSFFKDVYQKVPSEKLTMDTYLAKIKLGAWQDMVLDFRSGKIKKESCSCITTSGVFSERKVQGLVNHSNFINIDIDQKDNPDVNLISIRDNVYADPHVYAGHLSLSGKGLSLYIKINGKKHKESFLALEKYFANEYNLIIDTAAKDIPRLRIVSYDPELHENKRAKKWETYISLEVERVSKSTEYVTSGSDFDFVMDQIKSRCINIADDYHEWVKVGMAFANEFGDRGRSHFHDVSRYSAKYSAKDCDKKYDNILKNNRNKVQIASFFYLAKNAGLTIKSPRTQIITNVAKTRLRTVGKSGGAGSNFEAIQATKKYLQEIEGIQGDDVDEILLKIEEIGQPSDLKEKTQTQDKIEACLQVFKEKKLRLNKVTGNIEGVDGIVTDSLVNSYYLDAVAIDEGIKKEMFTTILFSNRIPKFDPFKDFIEKNKHLKPEGNIEKLLKTLSDEMTLYSISHGDDLKVTDYKDVFVKKWLISIMASIHSTYSLMILVLTGKQMTEKTNWFRGLLPEELRQYYGESKLDAGKDDEILMTQKLIICDDEFGGKSKQEAKKLKDLSSKQYFSIRRPYAKIPEDIRRIAVLCGTSNDDEILNDPTGNRRIIPLKINSIDKRLYDTIDKKDLFMEIYHLWREMGDDWMLTPQEVDVLNASTVKHEQDVLEKQLIERYCRKDKDRIQYLTTSDVKVRLDAITNQKLNNYKIGQSLKQLGFVRKSVRSIDDSKKVSQCWDCYIDPSAGAKSL